MLTRSTTAVDPPHLKVKEKDVNLIKSYCITISIQKNQLNSDCRVSGTKRSWPFLTMPTKKIIETTFSFPGFVPVCKKSVHYIWSCLRYSQFWNPMTRLATHPFSTMPCQKNFLNNF